MIYLNTDSVSVRHLLNVTRVNDVPFSGVLYTFYPGSTDTASYVTYKNGIKEGIAKQFYPDHRVKELRCFSNGQKVDSCSSWWDNGKRRSLAYFKNDEYEGIYREWSQEGLLTKEMQYELGHEEGLQKAWYDNGQIKSNYVIRKGRRYGLLGTKNCKNVSASLFQN